VGLAFYPVAAGGGRLRYPNAAEVNTINEQRLLAFELSPALSVNLPHGVSLGLGYRVTFLRYNAQRGPVGDPVLLDMALRGTNFAGVRAGAQWRANEHWVLGASYRHQITLRATGEEGTAAEQRLTGVAGEVTVPAKAVLGARMDYGPIGVAIDVDYIFNRQYEKVTLTGDLPDQGSRLEVDLVSRWKNTVTVHAGLEGRIQRFAIRAGYAFDQAASNRAFPSTFGSPPSHGHYATAGFGYMGERWKTNVAVSHRMSADVTLDDNEIDETACGIFCASGGNYRSRLTGVLADFSYQFAL
ncbi:MAG: outer membrane protein transport protein, partial [Nannocystaceae bacterium]|nr:outer membrane protein transport protein [Nannocystaceae bacterium]